MSIAETIRKQIGNEAFFLMGTCSLTASEKALAFAIKGCRKINVIKVTLEPSDTYKIEFFKSAKRISSYSGIYVDQLHDTIERETGLFVSFRRRQSA